MTLSVWKNAFSEKLLYASLILEGRSNTLVNEKAKTNDIGGPEECDKRQLLLQKSFNFLKITQKITAGN